MYQPNGGNISYITPSEKLLMPGLVRENYGEIVVTSFMRIGGIGQLGKREIMAVIDGVKNEICLAYNDRLNILNNPATGRAFDGRIYTQYEHVGPISPYGASFSTSSGDPFFGQPTACTSNGGDFNAIDMVLKEY